MPDSPLQIRELTEAYHKARRQFVLYSGILLAWEYVGVKIGTISQGKESVPADFETPFAKGKVTLLHPEVIPVVIFLLVVYFGYRLGIEWLQCDQERREKAASVFDISVSYLIGIAATILFVFQRTDPHFRLANLASGQMIVGLIIGFIVSVGLLFAMGNMSGKVYRVFGGRGALSEPKEILFLYGVLLLAGLSTYLLSLYLGLRSFDEVAVGFRWSIPVFVVMFTLFITYRTYHRRKLRVPRTSAK